MAAFDISEQKLHKIGQRWIGPNAHVVRADPLRKRIYFPLKNVAGKPVLRIETTE